MDRYLFKLNNKFIYTICQGVVIVSLLLIITFSLQKSPSYRNQSIDLQSKSIDWFLYARNLHHETGKWSFRGIFKNLSNICDTVILANFFCFYPWTIFAKSSIADICQAPKKAPVICYCIWSYSGVSMLSSLYMYLSKHLHLALGLFLSSLPSTKLTWDVNSFLWVVFCCGFLQFVGFRFSLAQDYKRKQ